MSMKSAVELSEIERPIKIATNKFVVMNIQTVKKITRGWIDLSPKTKTGELMVDYPVHPKEFQLMIEHFKKNPGRYILLYLLSYILIVILLPCRIWI